MKRAVIIGATSGIGQEIAKLLWAQGWQIGIAGRRSNELEAFLQRFPERVAIQTMDVTAADAPDRLHSLIQKTGGMDLFFLSSGIGYQNAELKAEKELATARTNVEGFIRMVDAAYHYFIEVGGGHIAVISSIAGTKGLGVAPAYSATKRFQNTYIDALEQLAHLQKRSICFTDIRPGFVATNLLNDGKNYPMLMRPEKVARITVKALNKKKRVVVIDWRYRILVFFWRLVPRALWKYLPIQTSSK